jgi:hypothetical protein
MGLYHECPPPLLESCLQQLQVAYTTCVSLRCKELAACLPSVQVDYIVPQNPDGGWRCRFLVQQASFVGEIILWKITTVDAGTKRNPSKVTTSAK